MKSFLAMLCFFTRIPVRMDFDASEDIFVKGVKYLFLISLIIGVPIGLVFMIGQWTGQYIAAFLSLLLYLFLSGGLHIDGLADTADAFGSNTNKQRMRQIMKDSKIGTFGVLSICVYIAGMVLFMAQADCVIVGLFPLAGRTCALICARLYNYSGNGGMGKSFVQAVRAAHIIAAVMVYMVISLLFCFDFSGMVFNFRYAMALLFPYAVSLAVTAFIVFLMSRKLSGITGDVIGFSIEISSFLYVLTACLFLRLW